MLATVNHALELVHESNDPGLHVEDLCRKIGCSERTLLRMFHGILEMGPKHYLLMRKLNLIRKELRRAAFDGRQVTEVMTHCGATEFGRIAGQYRDLFGELPSDTIRVAQNIKQRETGGGGARSEGDLAADVV